MAIDCFQAAAALSLMLMPPAAAMLLFDISPLLLPDTADVTPVVCHDAFHAAAISMFAMPRCARCQRVRAC